jgi:NADPH-dependent ferric siderophore reductase
MFSPDHAADHLLLVADDTGLPAVHSIVAGLPAAMPTTIVVEVTTEADQQDVGREVTWLHRAMDTKPGSLALAHVAALAPLSTGRGQAWLAGEAGLATGLRRHLVRERGYAKADVSFTGYFRHGRAQYA